MKMILKRILLIIQPCTYEAMCLFTGHQKAQHKAKLIPVLSGINKTKNGEVVKKTTNRHLKDIQITETDHRRKANSIQTQTKAVEKSLYKRAGAPRWVQSMA